MSKDRSVNLLKPTDYVMHHLQHKLIGYKNQSVYAVSGTSRCLFSDKYSRLLYLKTQFIPRSKHFSSQL